jgi:hypothetical protein
VDIVQKTRLSVRGFFANTKICKIRLTKKPFCCIIIPVKSKDAFGFALFCFLEVTFRKKGGSADEHTA